MPISIPLTLRTIKGSKLTFAELDGNFLDLRNAIYNLDNIVSFLSGSTDTFVTGGTYNTLTNSIDFTGNEGFIPFSVDLSSLPDTFVTGGTYNPLTLSLNFTGNEGFNPFSVDVSALSGQTDTFVTGGTYNSLTNSLDFTGNEGFNPFSVDVSALSGQTDTFVTGGTFNQSTITLDFTGNEGFNPFSVNVTPLLDTYVSGGTYNPTTGCATFVTTSGYTFDVCGFLTGFTDTNFANTDLTFTGNRTHDIGTSNYLYITNDPTFSTVSSFLYLAPSETQIGNYDITNPLYLGFSGGTAYFQSNTNKFFSVINNLPGNEIIINESKSPGTIFTVKGGLDDYLISSDPVSDRIGIGTNTPSEKLEVSGNTKISGGLNIGVIGGTTSITNLGIDINGNVVSGITGNLLYEQTTNFTAGIPLTIIHGLNTSNVIVQIIDTNTNELIYGTINNYQTNSINVTLSTSINGVKVLVIGTSVTQIVPKGSIVYYFGHDSVSPLDSTNYFIGDYVALAPITTTNVGRRVIVQKTGQITQVSIRKLIGGTLGSAESNIFVINNVTQATSSTITTTETFNASASLNNYVLASPLNVNSGDRIEIRWTTPAFVTNPTAVRQGFNVVLEY